MPFSKFQEVEKIFSSEGIYKIYVRELQEKQDNTRNQIYCGPFSDCLCSLVLSSNIYWDKLPFSLCA